MFVHTVLFHLKPNTPPVARDQLVAACRTLLAQIPTVRHLWSGVPAGTSRDVVDASYQVGLTVCFDNRAGHDVYQEHPIHLQFIAENKSHWEKVRVFDFA